MKKFFSKKTKEEKTIKKQDEKEDGKEEEQENLVKCMDCGNRTKLFYDLSSSVRDEGDEKDLEGYDLDDDRDPIRCVLCRKYTKSKDNEPIQCEDCQTNATVFFWSGPHLDVILCDECYREDQENGGGYESTPGSEE